MLSGAFGDGLERLELAVNRPIAHASENDPFAKLQFVQSRHSNARKPSQTAPAPPGVGAVQDVVSPGGGSRTRQRAVYVNLR